MKNLILILLVTFYSLRSYSNGESSGKSTKDASENLNTICEAPSVEDSSSIKTTRSSSGSFSFHGIKSPFFKEKCKELKDTKELTKNEKIFHKVLKILLVTLSIGLVAFLVSIASASLLLFIIPL